MTTDRSRGALPPAETLQCESPRRERIGWRETFGTSVFLVLLAAWAVLL